MVTSDTTSMSRTRFMHLPNTNHQILSGVCAFYQDAPSASRIAKSPVVTKCMGRPLNLLLLLYLERHVNSIRISTKNVRDCWLIYCTWYSRRILSSPIFSLLLPPLNPLSALPNFSTARLLKSSLLILLMEVLSLVLDQALSPPHYLHH